MKKKNENKSKKVENVKTNSKQNVTVESAGNELRKLSTILVTIVGVVCVFYIITVIVTKNNQTLQYVSHDEISQISYNYILASDIFKKNESYYVLIKDNNDAYISLYENYISSYTELEEHLPVYYVDLNDALNQKYRAEESDFSKENLKFNDTTLLKISNGNIESSYEGSMSINEHLKSLVIE